MGSGSSFSVCMHILTLLAHCKGEYLSSDFIAGSINMNPAMVRREIMKLRRHGIVESKEGKSGGTRLSRSPAKISLNEVFQALKEPDTHIFMKYKNKPNQNCPVGKQIDSKLENLFSMIDIKVEDELGKVTLEEFYYQSVRA